MKSPVKPSQKPLKVAIACGGTGGHLFPGVAVADALREMGHQALLLLSDKQVDHEAAESVDHLAVSLPSAGWQKGGKLKFVRKLGQGFLTCRWIFKKASTGRGHGHGRVYQSGARYDGSDAATSCVFA
jgi:hypothetical protein